jgi:hypothetical protein
MIKFKNPIAIILLISFFLISTCTTNDSITGSSDQTLGKTTDVADSNSTAKVWPVQEGYLHILDAMESWLFGHNLNFNIDKCLIENILGGGDSHSCNQLTKSYEFRDNYLSKSDKGEVYTVCYYFLSKYGVENNLVNEYHKEHYDLLKSSIEIAYDLQYGSNTNRILINKSTSDHLKDMLEVYRNSQNVKEIEPILNYLEADLEKYYNKPKYEIAADFEEN